MKNSPFQRELSEMLNSPLVGEKEEVLFRSTIKLRVAGSSPGATQEVKFEGSKLVPTAVIQKARYDKDFDGELQHAIAYYYRDNDVMEFCVKELKKSNPCGSSRQI